MKTADLDGKALDTWVRVALGAGPGRAPLELFEIPADFAPSTNPAHGHPIMEREGITEPDLAAAMRIFVARKLGEEVAG